MASPRPQHSQLTRDEDIHHVYLLESWRPGYVLNMSPRTLPAESAHATTATLREHLNYQCNHNHIFREQS